MLEEATGEAHVPAEQPTPRQAPRVPTPNEQPVRPGNRPRPAPEGSSAFVGVIWRVRDRATFEALRRRGRRVRRGPVTVVYLPEGGAASRVAYGVSRRVGNAVVRNRVRRRLRAVVDELERDGDLRRGAYLVTARGGVDRMTFGELRQVVATCVTEVVEQESR